jgi:multimeric flavodoxin WrbA
MKILVVYYSGEGHTKKVAEALTSELEAEMVKIEALKESGMAIKGIKAALGLKSDIRPCKTDLNDKIIWWLPPLCGPGIPLHI